MNALATKTEDLPLAPAPSVASSPMLSLLSDAIQKGMPIEVIREIKALAKEAADEEAGRAFKVAFAAFKAEAVEVFRNKSVTDGPLNGRKYAELHAFVDAAVPALAKHGLSHSWAITKDEKDWIEVTCTIEHAMGGSKQVSMGGPPDAGGAKNSLQARISTVTYLERATFKAACGLAEKGDDDDGRSGGSIPAALTEAQVEEIKALIDKAVAARPGTDYAAWLSSFLEYMGVEGLNDIPAKNFAKAKREIENAIRQAGRK